MSDHAPAAVPAELPRFGTSMVAVGVAALVGVVGLAVCFLAGGSSERAMHSYLLGVLYWLTIGLGSMFMLLTFHAAGARWVTGFRRVMETLASGVWIYLILMIPVFMNLQKIFRWAKPGYKYGEEGSVLWFKEWWLEPTHFVTRGVIYLVSFAVAVYLLNAWSRAQDTSSDVRYFTRLVRLGSGGVPVLGLVGTAMAFDWIMSLDPDWGSTIFGAYVLAGAYLAALAVTVLVTHRVRGAELRGLVGQFEYHNLGKLLFTLVCFWAYLGYAQYMLMWIANLPEEIKWFIARTTGEWRPVFWLLVFSHFLVPFFALLPKAAKYTSGYVSAVAVLILANHFIDLTWLVLPSLHDSVQLSDFAALVGVGGLHVAFVLWRFNGVVAAPKGDPNFGAPVAVH